MGNGEWGMKTRWLLRRSLDVRRESPRHVCLHSPFPIPHSGLLLTRFLVLGVLALLAAELLQLEAVGAASLFLGAVVPRLALRAFQPDVFTHLGVWCIVFRVWCCASCSGGWRPL